MRVSLVCQKEEVAKTTISVPMCFKNNIGVRKNCLRFLLRRRQMPTTSANTVEDYSTSCM